MEGNSQELENQNETNVSKSIDYKTEYEKLASTNERLLDESRKNKSRFQEISSKLEAFEQEKVEKDGNLEEKLKYLQKKNEEILSENSNLKTNVLSSQLQNALREVAPDCHNYDLVMNNPAYADDIKASIDLENLSVETEVLKSIYAKDKENNPFLYGKTKIPNMVNGGAEPRKSKKADLSKMTTDEMIAHFINEDKKRK